MQWMSLKQGSHWIFTASLAVKLLIEASILWSQNTARCLRCSFCLSDFSQTYCQSILQADKQTLCEVFHSIKISTIIPLMVEFSASLFAKTTCIKVNGAQRAKDWNCNNSYHCDKYSNEEIWPTFSSMFLTVGI